MPSERLKRCIDAGSVECLFPLLSKWSEEELQALVADLDDYYEEVTTEFEATFQREAFRPEVFLNKQASQRLDAAHKQAHLDAMAMCSEIGSVAFYYLKDELSQDGSGNESK